MHSATYSTYSKSTNKKNRRFTAVFIFYPTRPPYLQRKNRHAIRRRFKKKEELPCHSAAVQKKGKPPKGAAIK